VTATQSTSQARYVLIVDDDADARELMGELVGTLGHHALQAASAVEAIACAEQNRVDVALIDLGLPGTDGYEVARRIRATIAGGHIRLVALTGYSDDVSRRTASEAGFDDFLVKPADASDIAAAVSEPRRAADAGLRP
jgi:CheY-like chemotaxis protein